MFPLGCLLAEVRKVVGVIHMRYNRAAAPCGPFCLSTAQITPFLSPNLCFRLVKTEQYDMVFRLGGTRENSGFSMSALDRLQNQATRFSGAIETRVEGVMTAARDRRSS